MGRRAFWGFTCRRNYGAVGLPSVAGVATGAAAPSNSTIELVSRVPALATHTLPLRSTAMPRSGVVMRPPAVNPPAGLRAFPLLSSSARTPLPVLFTHTLLALSMAIPAGALVEVIPPTAIGPRARVSGFTLFIFETLPVLPLLSETQA